MERSDAYEHIYSVTQATNGYRVRLLRRVLGLDIRVLYTSSRVERVGREGWLRR